MTTAGRASLGAARTAMPVGAKDMQSTMKDSIWQRATVGDSEVSNHNITSCGGVKTADVQRALVNACHLPATHRANKVVAWRGC